MESNSSSLIKRGIIAVMTTAALGLASAALYKRYVSKNLRKKKFNVVFVLGGPGAGKGTQCEKIVKQYGYKHISAGDCLREEKKKEGSQFGKIIQRHIEDGTIVPVDITLDLMRKKMNMELKKNGTTKFLIDGFPRNKDNFDGWMRKMSRTVHIDFCLYLNCSEKVMEERILGRAKAGSGRADDNIEAIKKRFATYHAATMPIIEVFKSRDLLREIDAGRPIEDVFIDISKLF